MMRALPSPLTGVTVPRFFTPTAVAGAGACRLRLVLQSAPRLPGSLPAGPAAALGSLTHRFLELRATSTEPATRIFERSQSEISTALAADPASAHFADLAAVLGSAAWSRFRFALIDRGGRPWRAAADRTTGNGQNAALSRFGQERPLTSLKLRLKGRADQISRLSDGAIEIRDHKTGAVFDASGELEERIKVQLRCYGLVMTEIEPDSVIRLVVGNGADHEVSFGPADRRKLKRHLAVLGAALPAGAKIAAADLAAPGSPCATCSFRHRCSSYLDVAPRWWGATTEHVLPRDTWGRILEVVPCAGGTFDVTLRDAAGRLVRLDRLDFARWHSAPQIGAALWVFNLESPISRARAHAANLHPAVFHECPADSTQNRAWSLQLYSGQPHAPRS